MTVPTAAELVEAHRIYVSALSPYTKYWPVLYEQLPDDSSAKVALGCFAFYLTFNIQWIALSRSLHDSRVMEKYGGFNEWRKLWRSYDYARDHVAALTVTPQNSDSFLVAGQGTCWLFWEGQVADTVSHAEKVASVWAIVVKETGGAATDPQMDAHRHSISAMILVQNAHFLIAAGLEAQAASWVRQVGLGQWPTDVTSRTVDHWSSQPMWQGMAPGDAAGVRTLAEFAIVLDCLECCPQSDASNERMLSILRGTATDCPSGIEALAALNAGCREAYCHSAHDVCARAARIAERLGEHGLSAQYAERMLARGGHELNVSRMQALLGRQAARSGDSVTAVARWQEAAQIAMDARWHLQALRVGWQCGGAEGGAIAAAACTAMKRPEATVLEELQAAGAVIPQRPAAAPPEAIATEAKPRAAGSNAAMAITSGEATLPSRSVGSIATADRAGTGGDGEERSLEVWMRSIDLDKYLDAIVDQGCDDLKFLLGMDYDDVLAMCDDAGMKKLHIKKLLKAIQKLRAPTAAPVAAPTVGSTLETARALEGDGGDQQQQDEQAVADDSASGVPVRVWLDVVQPGFGAKFSSAFEAAGLDVLDDLADSLDGSIDEPASHAALCSLPGPI